MIWQVLQLMHRDWSKKNPYWTPFVKVIVTCVIGPPVGTVIEVLLEVVVLVVEVDISISPLSMTSWYYQYPGRLLG